jgi:enamine deaminase RidA (YjgF/YER057c/UK114 family)
LWRRDGEGGSILPRVRDRESSVPDEVARGETLRYSPALRDGRLVFVSGHIGRDADGFLSDDPEVQMREAFRSIGETLSDLGATWADVVEITSYHVGLQGQKDALLRVHHEFIRVPPYPAWTAAGVTELFNTEAVVEISVVAVLAEHPS